MRTLIVFLMHIYIVLSMGSVQLLRKQVEPVLSNLGVENYLTHFSLAVVLMFQLLPCQSVISFQPVDGLSGFPFLVSVCRRTRGNDFDLHSSSQSCKTLERMANLCYR